mgnify:CR=1 FL=1
MNHAHWTNKEETFYSYATGNIYYTMQKNYNEVKAVPLLSAPFHFSEIEQCPACYMSIEMNFVILQTKYH